MRGKLKTDCRHFQGERPCEFNKLFGSECPSCDQYDPIKQRILFIKLDAMGDVVRSGSLLPALIQKHSPCSLTWLTRRKSQMLVAANPFVDQVLMYDTEGIAYVVAAPWDYVYSLSNDSPSASVATLANARKETVGFTIGKTGGLQPSNDAALRWLEMASFDRLKKANLRSYQRIMYEIADCDGPIARPPLTLSHELREYAAALFERLPPAIIIGVNVGSGKRWRKKMLAADRIASFCDNLVTMRDDLAIVLLGGQADAEKICAVLAAVKSSDRVFELGTHHSPLQFAALIDRCEVLVSGDTLALHLATAVDTPVVAVFGPTSATEIEDYDGLVTKVSTKELDCLVCYDDCDKTSNCMTLLDLNLLSQEVLRVCNRRLQPAAA